MPPKKSKRARPTAHDAFISEAADDGINQLPLSDEEDEPRSRDKLKIIAQDGQLGFSHAKKGFDSRTNFTLEIIGDIFSIEHQLKGSVFNIKLSHGEILPCFVPEKCLMVPEKFKEWCDKQHIDKKRITLDIPKPAWAKFIRSMLGNYETSANYRRMEFVECVGFQHHTAKGRGGLNKKSARDQHQTGIDIHYFRYCFGPGLFFKFDGTVDKDPIHFWFPWLSDKLNSSEQLLEPLDFLPSDSFSLESLIRAYTPGNFWQFVWTAAATISSANASIIRFKCKQHPSTVLIGDKGVGKTFALEACLWSLCGMSDETKADPDMDTRTLKACAGMTTNPIPVDDGESTKKEAKLVTSAFDRTKYKTKNGTVKNIAVYMITSNIMFRVERTGDREHIQVFHSFDGGMEEARACKEAYDEVTTSSEVPIGFTIKYGQTVLTKEWDIERKKLEAELEVIMGTKDRTIGCYALIGMAVKYIYDHNKGVFDSLGRTWEEMMTCFLPGKFRDAVRMSHPEISRPDLILKNYLRDIARILSTLSISERKRKVCMGETMKTGTRQAVIGIRLSETLFQIVNGTSMHHVQQIIALIGGIPKQSTRKFLSDSEEVTEEDPKITEENIAQYNALLWPLKEVESSLILRFCQLLGEPNFRSIADLDTPSGFSSALESSNLSHSSSRASSNITSSTRSDMSDGIREAFGSSDVLSSTVREGASIPEEDRVELSVIQNLEILFCPKCAEIFQTKAGRTKHLKVCKEIGIYERNDIVAFVCSDCGYIAKSSRGLTQHRVQGSNCQERTFSKTMSRLELSITNGDSNVALDQSSGLSCCGRKFSNKSGLISHQRSKAHKEASLKSSSTSQPAPSQISEPSSSCTSLPGIGLAGSSAHIRPDVQAAAADPALHGAHARPDVQATAADPALHGAHARPDVQATAADPALHGAQVPANSAISAPDLLRLRERRSSRRASISMSQAEGIAPVPVMNTSLAVEQIKFQCVCLKSYATENGLRNHKVRFCKTLKQQTAAANEKQGVPSEPATSETANSEPATENNTCPKCKAEFHSRSSLGLHVLTHF